MERLEKGVAAAAKPVVKTAEDMFKDALQSLTGNYKDKQALQAEEAKKIQEARVRLAQINKEIVEARKKREHLPAAPEAQLLRAGQEKKVVEKQKKESVLAKMIKSRQGSKEAMQRASG
ncbi:MAG: G5 domain protein [Candidatus Amesbacteria bacterium GW2011_GWA1_46_35]|uniref:G5 domain protein n=1 Tax=Candidatus Amesbacteria bacterium GW2011_GWC2_45_19 TaxID=1618366 RepID=A0A0G1Q1V8_9BACT|nr:MAG: G5 domain protein [Candidatus Amesbacteria bacterium GW2011_GWC2_45_19]KKU38087.1 MAG: G5 domain protein [Candidatus Amesbacteria bacterium GW2011_GWA1_46_35]KKU69060.1 MAG: G5 domain protein [Microgenomates group bacterium GW2011_GWC1_47_20]